MEIGSYSTKTNSDLNAFTTIGAGPVIIKDNKVLLIKDLDDTFWKFPGGTTHDDESLRQTAIREAEEETGLIIEIESEPFFYTFHKVDNEKNVVKYYVLVHYKARVVSDAEPVQNEGTKLEYFGINELPEDIAPNVKAAIEHFLR